MSDLWHNLNEQFNSLPTWGKTAVGVVAVGVPLYVLYSCNRKRKSPIKTDFKNGVVYLYQFPRSPVIPSLSPFCLKLETWLRMADINYENVDVSPWTRSKEGQLPFVELDGIEYDDSGLIIKELATRLKRDAMEADIAVDQKGAAHAFEQMIENTTFWTYIMVRYLEKMDEMLSEKIFGPLPFVFSLWFLRWSFQSAIKKRMHAHGIGRHGRDEIVGIGIDDLKALSAYLGEKKFICGDQPTRADATLFGVLAQIVYIPIVTPHGDLIRTECQNLQKYCDRMKRRFWPDWDEALSTRSLHTTWKKTNFM